MLIMNVTIYQHFTNDRKDEEFDFDDFLSEIDDRKERKKVKNVFKTNVSSQKIRMRKEEGATTAASHLPSLSGPLRYVYRPDRQRSSMETFTFSGKAPLTT